MSALVDIFREQTTLVFTTMAGTSDEYHVISLFNSTEATANEVIEAKVS